MNPFSSKPEGFQLTAADYADLTALGLDVASMIAQIAPGYGNIVSSAGGLGSTIATAVGDVSRDGLDWGGCWKFRNESFDGWCVSDSRRWCWS